MLNLNTVASLPSSLLKRLPIRPARLFIRVRNILAALIAFVIAIAGLSSLDNALSPVVQLTPVATGPAALSAVSALEIDTRTNTLYAGTNNGLYRSTDEGLTWTAASNGLPATDVQKVMYDSRTATLFAVVIGSGMYTSTDGAQTWVNISNGFRGNQLMSVGIDPRVNMLYAGMAGYGMYTSADGGTHWDTVGFGLSNTHVRAFLAGKQPGEVFAATEFGVYHTTVVTGTWDLLTSQTQKISAWSLWMDPRSGVILAGTEQGILKIEQQGLNYIVNLTGLTSGTVESIQQDSQTGTLYAGTSKGVFRSNDAGATWTPANVGLRSSLVHALLKSGETLLAGTDDGLFLSRDGAATWQPVSANPEARSVQALLTSPTDDVVYAGTLGGGVFRSNDAGANWQPVNTGLPNTVVQALGVDHSANALYAGTRKGVYRSALDQIAWTLASPRLSDQEIVAMSVDERHGNVYVISSYGDVFRSGVGGTRWDIVGPLQKVFARTVAVSGYSSAVYVGAYKGGVQISRDFGITWRPVGGNLPDRNIEALAVDERNGTVYAGTLTGAVFSLSSERGQWLRAGGNLPGNIVAMAVDRRNGDVFAALKAGLYRLANGEPGWKLVTNGLSHTNILSLAPGRLGGAIYAGTLGGGAFRTENAGETWQFAGAGLTDTEIRGIVADDASGALMVGVTDRGVFRSEDGGKTWNVSSFGLNELKVQSMAVDETNGAVSVITTRALPTGINEVPGTQTATGHYQFSGGATGWQPQNLGIGNLLNLIIPSSSYGFGGRLPGGGFVWASRGGGDLWARFAASLSLVNGTIRLLSDGRGQLITAWGPEIAQSQPGTGYGRVPLLWLVIRVLAWEGMRWLVEIAPWWWLAALALVVLGALGFLLSRLRFSRKFGVPVRTAMFAPGNSERLVRAESLERSWPKWERAVRSELFRYGDLKDSDLLSIPAPFRMYAMRRFASTYSRHHSMKLEGRTLVAQAHVQIRRWTNAWLAMKETMKRQPNEWKDRRPASQLASAFGAAFDLKLSPAHDIDAVRAYVGEADEGLLASQPLALLFIADNEALKRTAQNLADAYQEVKRDGMAGIVISLGRPGRDVDVTTTLRNTLAESAQTRQLVVLENRTILEIMAANDPEEELMARIRPRNAG